MKKMLLALLGALIVAVPAIAATVNVASDGTVGLESSSKKIEVIFDEGVLDLGDVWKQAFVKRGTVVPVKSHFEYQRDGLFHIENRLVVDVGVVYDGTRMSVVRSVAGESKTIFTPYVIFWLLSVVFMSIGVWCMVSGKKFIPATITAIIFVVAATFALAFVSAATPTFIATIFASGAFVSALGAVLTSSVTEDDGSRGSPYRPVGLYYVLMVVSMAAFLFV